MIRKRLLQYLDLKGISKYKFYKDNGVSNGFLDKEGSVRSDICEKISYQYEDINLIWLITGKGEMLLKDVAQLTGANKPPTDHQHLPTAIEDIIANKVVERLKPMLDTFGAMDAYLTQKELDKSIAEDKKEEN